ncbi:hypothetical protein LCGC14_0848520 [marine sediment metagenome]|uniref:ClpX-type ZB domain-containing protein n=1 Tax=marine sediment metagenome TaxID=412755 RepID=A0A0F9RVR7_9ZZZZ
MIKVCAWCQKDMGETPPCEDKSVTHGICKQCKEELEADAQRGS